MDKLAIKLFLYITAILVFIIFLVAIGIIFSLPLVTEGFFHIEGILIIVCILLFIYRNRKILKDDPIAFLRLEKIILITFFLLGILSSIWYGFFRYDNFILNWTVERNKWIVHIFYLSSDDIDEIAFLGSVIASLSFYFILPFIMVASHKYFKLTIINKIGDPLISTNQFLRKQILLTSILYFILWIVSDIVSPSGIGHANVPGVKTIFYLTQYLIFLSITYSINKYLLKKRAN